MSDANRSPQYKAPGPHLDAQTSYRLGVPLIYLRGELDHDSANYLRGVIDGELADHPQAMLLELGELTYMDSGGLSLMFELSTRFADSGWLGVVEANPGVTRLLEITGLADRSGFRMFPSLAAASAALNEAPKS